MKRILGLLAALVTLGFGTTGNAATATLFSEGTPFADLTFTGARGIKVDGAFYRVRFEKGTCDEVFDGCDTANFAFSTQADAETATRALFDLLLADALERQTQGLGLDIGIFERDNSISSNDCSVALCELVTPYDKQPFGSSGLVPYTYRVKLRRTSGLISGFPSSQITSPANFGQTPYSTTSEKMYMVWTATVPVPASLPLLITAVAGFAGLGMWRKRQAQA